MNAEVRIVFKAVPFLYKFNAERAASKDYTMFI